MSKKNKISELISVFLIVMLCINVLVIPKTNAQSVYYSNDGFEGNFPFSSYYTFSTTDPDGIIDVDKVPGESNKAVRVSLQKPPSGSYSGAFTRNFTTPVTIESGKKYVFSTRVFSDVRGNVRDLFIYGASANSYFVRLKDVSGETGTIGLFAPGESTPIGQRFSSGEWMEIVVVLDGGTKKYDIYAKGAKINSSPLSTTNMPSSIPGIGMKYTVYGATVNYFDDIYAYSLDDFAILNASVSESAAVATGTKTISMTFNSLIDTDTLQNIALSDDQGRTVSISTSLSNDPRKLTVTLNEVLKPSTLYTIQYNNLKDTILNAEASGSISFETDSRVYIPGLYVNDNFEDGFDFSERYSATSTSTDAAVDVDQVDSEVNHAIKVSVPKPATGSFETKFSRTLSQDPVVFEEGKKYVFATRIKSNVASGVRRIIGYGGATNDYFVVLKDVPNSGGLMGLHKTADNATRIGTKTFSPNEWIDIAVVLDGGAKTYDVYAGGEKLTASPLSMNTTVSSVTGLAFTSINYADSINYFDDIVVYKANDVSCVSASTDAYSAVHTYDKQLSFGFNAIINRNTLDKIVLRDERGDTVQTTNTIDPYDRMKVNVTIDGQLLGNTNYTMSFDGLEDLLGSTVSLSKTFVTDDVLNISEPRFELASGTPVFSLVPGKITVTVGVDKRRYLGSLNSYVLAVGYYYENKLLDVVAAQLPEITEESQPVSVAIDVPDADDGYYLKIFHLTDLEHMQPIKKSQFFDK